MSESSEKIANEALMAMGEELELLRIRCDGYQASIDWAVNSLAAALHTVPDTVRALEFYARCAAEEIERLRTELAKTKEELDLRVKSGSAVDRLHNICRALADEADGSAWSREEWERLDEENTKLQRHVVRLGHDLNAAKSVIANIVESEVEPLKALLREASKTLIEVVRMPNQEHVADAHNETVKRIRAALGDEPADDAPRKQP